MKLSHLHHVTRLTVLACLAIFVVHPSFVRADDAPKAPPTTGKCMMWKVSSDTATVYLVGSMHLATPEMYPLPKEMEDAFGKSDVLVVEVNINKVNQADMMKLVQEKGMYPEGETVSGHIAKDTMKALSEYCTKLGLPVVGVEKMKPWVLSMTIEVLAVQQLGLDPKLGIDKHFLDEADKAAKTVEELESADSQIDLLAGLDPKLQEIALASTLDEVKDLKEDIGKLKDAWTSGDTQAINELLTKKTKDHPKLKEVQKKLIDDRNAPMAEKVETYLKGNKTVFVVAGVAHMVGDKGIVKILQDHKHDVEQSTVAKNQN